MPESIRVDDGPIYFISDAHLGAPEGPPDREARLLELLGGLPGRTAALFVLGDLFDFWFEYRQVVPKSTFPITRALASIRESGCPVYFLGGNHDFWIADYLRREIEIEVFDHPIDARLQGRRVHLAHGDGLGPGDWGYKALRILLRNRVAIAGYRALHPDLGIPLAHFASKLSRHKHETPREVLLPRLIRDVAGPRLQGEISAMVMGHVHHPAHFQSRDRDYLIIGDWIDSFTHVRMEEGRFSLWQGDGPQQRRIAPLPLPGEETVASSR